MTRTATSPAHAVCGICRTYAVNAHLSGNPLCSSCLRVARERAGLVEPARRAVDMDLLPLAAQLRYGEVPTHTTSDEFHLAVSRVQNDLDTRPEAHWHIEAVRERRINPGRSLDAAKGDIAARVLERIARRERRCA